MRLSTMVFIFVLASFSTVDAVLFGKIAELGQFKYYALLKLQKGGVTATCGGAIIGERHIITAWHCVEDFGKEGIEVIVGAVEYDKDANGQSYRVAAVKLHESRSCGPGQDRCYDIAVLVTQDFIKDSQFVEEIELPTEDIIPGTECVFSGFGIVEKTEKISKTLRYGPAKILSRSTCYPWYPNITDYECCFQKTRGSFATSGDGDSGGPVVCDGQLAGIIIRGTSRPVAPVLLINVYQLLDFINRALDTVFCSSEVALAPSHTYPPSLPPPTSTFVSYSKPRP